MTGIARVGDTCTPHGPFAASQMATGSPNVIINGQGACRVGDITTVHCTPFAVCHIGTAVEGDDTVLINGQPALRIGDSLSCGAVVIGGSSNVSSGS